MKEVFYVTAKMKVEFACAETVTSINLHIETWRLSLPHFPLNDITDHGLPSPQRRPVR